MLRAIVLGFGISLILGAAALALAIPAAWIPACELGVFGALIIGGTLFEQRYHFRTRAVGADWEPTGERFNDPVSGKLTEVRWNRVTGERAYVTLDANGRPSA